MQEQLANAVTNALGANNAITSTPATPRPPGSGQRIMVAMVQARESGCKCGPCQLLRQELEGLMDAMLKGMVEVAGSPDTEPS